MQGRLETGEAEPITWTREHQGARVFYTSLGHPADFEEPGFRQMLINALYWTTRRQPERRDPEARSAGN